MSAVLVNDGRVLLAEALKDRPVLFGIGGGLSEWGEEEPPAAALDSIGLVTPIIYKSAHVVQYVTPSPTGEVVLASGRYAVSETPTNHLNFQLMLDYGDVTEDVREIHVYVDPTLAAGQQLFTPTELESTGRLLVSERRKALTFDGNVGAMINQVVTF